MKHKLIISILILLLSCPAGRTNSSPGVATPVVEDGSWCLRPVAAEEKEDTVQSTGVTLEQMLEEVSRMPEVRIVVAAADSDSALDGVNEFIRRAGTAVRVWLVGDEAAIKQVIRENNFTNLADIVNGQVVMKENVAIVPAGPADQLRMAVDCAIDNDAHVLLKGNTQTNAMMPAITKHPRKSKLIAEGAIAVHGRYFQKTPIGSALYADGGINIQEDKKEDKDRLALKEKVVRGTLKLAAACGMGQARIYLVVGNKETPSRDLNDARELLKRLHDDIPNLEIVTPEEVFVMKARGAGDQGTVFIYPDGNVNVIYKACDMKLPWRLEHVEDVENAAGKISIFKKISADDGELGPLVITTPRPDAGMDAKLELVRGAIKVMKRHGIDCPKIALLSFNEKIGEFTDVPSMEDNKAIIKFVGEQKIPCVIKQVSWDIAMSPEAAAKKGESDSVSDPDILVCPTNTIGATLVHLCKNYGALRLPWGPKIDTSWGCAATIAIPSRADKDKFPEIVMAAFIAAKARAPSAPDTPLAAEERINEQNRMRRHEQIKGVADSCANFAEWANSILPQIYEDMSASFGRGRQASLILSSVAQSVFREAGNDTDYIHNTRVVCLRAGAEPIYEILKVAARITGEFPEERIHSVWATMGNLHAISTQPEQGAYFLKYLYDEGVISPDTTRIVFVDTDSRTTKVLGTEVLVYKTLLSPGAVSLANNLFGLKLPVWNSEGLHRAMMLFIALGQDYEEFIRAALADNYHDVNADDYMRRMDVKKIPLPSSADQFKIAIGIDSMPKLETIQDTFVLQENKAVPVLEPSYNQRYSGLLLLIYQKLTYLCLAESLAGALEEAGLDVAQGFDSYLAQVKADLTAAIEQEYGPQVKMDKSQEAALTQI